MLKPQFAPDQIGLQATHVGQTPLFESVFCLSESEACEVTRIYPDGAVYFLLGQGEGKAWGYLTRMKDAGVKVLTARLQDALRIASEPPQGSPEFGSLTYHFQVGAMGRRITFHGLDYGDFEALRDIAALINSNLEQVKTD
jgi:hypothetical protein